MINSVILIGLKLKKDMVKNTDKLHLKEIKNIVLIFLITKLVIQSKFQLIKLMKEFLTNVVHHSELQILK